MSLLTHLGLFCRSLFISIRLFLDTYSRSYLCGHIMSIELKCSHVNWPHKHVHKPTSKATCMNQKRPIYTFDFYTSFFGCIF